MAKGAYVGVGGVAHKVKKMYVGVGGVARKVKKVYVGVNGVARLAWSSRGATEVVVKKQNSSDAAMLNSDGTINTLYTNDLSAHEWVTFDYNGFVYRALKVKDASGYYTTHFQKKKIGATSWTTFRSLGEANNGYAYFMSFCKQDMTVTITRVYGYRWGSSQQSGGTVQIHCSVIPFSSLETTAIENLTYETMTQTLGFENGDTFGDQPIVYSNNGAKFLMFTRDFFDGWNTRTYYYLFAKNGGYPYYQLNDYYLNTNMSNPIKFGNYWFVQNRDMHYKRPLTRLNFPSADSNAAYAQFGSSGFPPVSYILDATSSGAQRLFLNGSTLVYVVVKTVNNANRTFDLSVYTTTDGVNWVLQRTHTSLQFTTYVPNFFHYMGETSEEWLFTCNSGYVGVYGEDYVTQLVMYSIKKSNYELIIDANTTMTGFIMKSGHTEP